MGQKNELTTVQKQYVIGQLLLFSLSPQPYQILLLKSARFTLHIKSFLKDLLRQTKDQIKKAKFGYCKWKQLPWAYYLGLKHGFAHKKAIGNLSFLVLLPITVFPKNI